MHSGTERWIEEPTRLKYSFGGILLYTARLSATTLDVHFSRLTTNPADQQPPWEAFSSEVRVARVLSHPIEGELPRLCLLPDAIRYVPSRYRRFYINLEGTFAKYLEDLSSESRYGLRRRIRKFTDLSGGAIRWHEFRRPEEMAEYHRLARQVSRETYQERHLDAGLADGEDFRRKLITLAEVDAVRGYILYQGEKPVAYVYCSAQQDILVYHKAGYDPEFHRHSPGTVLLYLMLESLFEQRRFQSLDFGRGEYPYKESLSTGATECADIYYFRRTSSNLLLAGTHSALDTFSSSTSNMLNRLGLKTKIKRFIRFKL